VAGPDTVDDILAHYGIKGMRWGVRRKEGSDGRVIGKAGGSKRPASNDHREAQELKKKKLSELSNSELRKLNERMNLEQNYSRLMQNNPSSMGRGLKVTQDLLKAAGQAYNTYNSPLVKELRKGLTNLN
jgi:hypothetical protein